MEEKEIIELSNEIVESLMRLSLGEKPGMLSNKVFKSLTEHVNFVKIKQLYADYLVNEFNGQYNSTDSLKKLSDLRFNLLALYNIEKA
jgi:hypothetical protein